MIRLIRPCFTATGTRRREPGDRGGGNASLWFVDREKGGESFGGDASFHITTLYLTNETLTVEAFHPDQLHHFENGTEPIPLHRFRWDKNHEGWFVFDPIGDAWVDFENN